VKLHDLKPAIGSRKAKRRVGRGIAAGQGKTAGRGTKGQKARAGGTIPAWFEGGQTPLHQRIPKLRGFRNLFKVEYEVVNVGDIARVAEAGGFEGGEHPDAKASKKGGAPVTVNQEILRAAGLVRRLDRPMKVLGAGDLSTALFVVADAFSASARSKIEAAGGTVSVLETPETKRPAIGVDKAEKAGKAEKAEKAETPEAASAGEAGSADVEAPAETSPAEEPQAETPKRSRAAKGKAEAADEATVAEPAAEATETAAETADEKPAPKARARKPRSSPPETDA
jgi:large subunit ribosomal protein L15